MGVTNYSMWQQQKMKVIYPVEAVEMKLRYVTFLIRDQLAQVLGIGIKVRMVHNKT